MAAAVRPQKAASPTLPGRGCSKQHADQLAAGLTALSRGTPQEAFELLRSLGNHFGCVSVLGIPEPAPTSRATSAGPSSRRDPGATCVGVRGRAAGVEGAKTQGHPEGPRLWMSTGIPSLPALLVPGSPPFPHHKTEAGALPAAPGTQGIHPALAHLLIFGRPAGHVRVSRHLRKWQFREAVTSSCHPARRWQRQKSYRGELAARVIPEPPTAHSIRPGGSRSAAPRSGHTWGGACFSPDRRRKFAEPTGLALAKLSTASRH